MTTETSKTVSYSTESSVMVPPGEAVVKKAIVQRATVDVPWTATAVNALGHKQPIHGSWIGTDSRLNRWILKTSVFDILEH